MHKEIYKLIERVFGIFEKAINGVDNVKERLAILLFVIMFGLSIFGITKLFNSNEKRIDKAIDKADFDCSQTINRLIRQNDKKDSVIVSMTTIALKQSIKMDSMVQVLNNITAKNIRDLESRIKIQEDEKKRLRKRFN